MGVAFLYFPLEPLDALAQLVEAAHAREHEMKLFTREGFFQEVHRAAAHGLDRVLHVALSGKNDHRQVGPNFENSLQDIEALLRAKIQIQQNGVELFFIQKREAQLTGSG